MYRVEDIKIEIAGAVADGIYPVEAVAGVVDPLAVAVLAALVVVALAAVALAEVGNLIFFYRNGY